MSHRTQLPIVIVFLSIIGGFTAFFVTGSQPQFTAYNFLLLCLAGAVSLVALSIEAFGAKTKHPQKGLNMSVGALISIGFLVWTWISTIFSGRFIAALYGVPSSLLGLITIAALTAIALCVYRFSGEFERILSFIAPFLALVTSVWANAVGASIASDGTSIDAAHLGFANSSELGLFLLILLPWTLSEKFPLFKNAPVVERVLRILIGVGLAYTAYSHQMRMALILMALVFIEYTLSYTKLRRRSRAWVMGSVFTLTTAAASIVAIFESTGILSTSIFSIRGRLWRIGLEIFADSPLFGAGADGYQPGAIRLARFANSLEGPPLYFTDGATSPHNVVVDIMTSFGLIGTLLALAGIIVFLLYILRSKTFQTFGPKTGSPAFVAAVASFLLLCTMPVTVNLLALVVMCGAIALKAGVPGQTVFTLTGKREMRFRVAIVAFGGILILLGIFDASLRLSLGPVNYYRPPTIEKALSAATFSGLDPYFAYNVNSAMVASFPQTNPALQPQLLSAFESKHTERALKIDKLDPYLALSRANALLVTGGDAQSVETLYRVALFRYPGFPDASAYYADWLLAQGRTLEALEKVQPLIPFRDAGMSSWDEVIARVEGAQK